MENSLLAGAALELSGVISAQLADIQTGTVILTRDQALLALGLIDGAREVLKRDS